MKKYLLAILIALTCVTVASARNRYSHDDSELPQAAKTTIKQNCKAKVSLVKIETEFGRIDEYEVILTDGTEITFDRNGNWKNVETAKNKSVPDGFVLPQIREYIKAHHPHTKIIGIEKKRQGYEVELSDGIDMEFSLTGSFQRYD